MVHRQLLVGLVLGLVLMAPMLTTPLPANPSGTAAATGVNRLGEPERETDPWATPEPTATPAVTATPVPNPGSPTTFRDTFDGKPEGPQPFRSPHWDVAVHARDNRHELRTQEAHHGSECQPPPRTHTISSYEETVFLCRDHLMTSIFADGYGVIVLTPDHLVDFSAGEAVIRFDISTFRSSERDWFNVWITPFEDNLQLPLQPGFPDLQGPPRRAVSVRLEAESFFCPEVWVDHQPVEDYVQPYRCQLRPYERIDGFPGPDAARRDTFEIRIARDRLKVGMPQYNFWWYDQPLRQPLDWTRGVVQFGHHSYSPEKGTRIAQAGPNTWHWDNVSISPAVPFTMIKGDKRYLEESSPTISFARPAPINAFLRFSAWGEQLELSFDGGGTWQSARRAAQHDDDSHIYNYWTAIPAGVQTVQVRGQHWIGGDWHVKDLAIWSSEAPPAEPEIQDRDPRTPHQESH